MYILVTDFVSVVCQQKGGSVIENCLFHGQTVWNYNNEIFIESKFHVILRKDKILIIILKMGILKFWNCGMSKKNLVFVQYIPIRKFRSVEITCLLLFGKSNFKMFIKSIWMFQIFEENKIILIHKCFIIF